MFFFRFLFFLILFVVVLSYLFGLVAKISFRKFQNRMNGSFKGQQNRREGHVSVSKPKPKEKMFQKDMGDYVDYEEVEE